jgi:hypothetical protein
MSGGLCARWRCAAVLLACLMPSSGDAGFVDQGLESQRLASEVEYRLDVGDAPFESVASMRQGWIPQHQLPFEGTGAQVRMWTRFDVPAAPSPPPCLPAHRRLGARGVLLRSRGNADRP